VTEWGIQTREHQARFSGLLSRVFRREGGVNRRDALFAIAALGAVGWPSALVAQKSGKAWRVGIVWAGASTGTASEQTFIASMKERGYEVGNNLIVDSRYAEGDPARFAALVEEVIGLKPDALLGTSTGVALEMKARTATIPIVTGTTGDPVGSGLVKSLARPGGNVTGIALLIHELGAKHLEMVADILPRARQVAVLTDLASEKSIREKYERLVGEAAKAKGLSMIPHRINSPEEVRKALQTLATRRADALLINPTPRLNVMRREICESAERIRLPVVGFSDEWAMDGALLSYGPSFVEAYRLAARYVDRIFKGDKPADLPVQQPTTFSLMVNARAAKLLGIALPPSILVRADRVID
jgi:putative tryptophan/tyrosine transport system substrate-binding protein